MFYPPVYSALRFIIAQVVHVAQYFLPAVQYSPRGEYLSRRASPTLGGEEEVRTMTTAPLRRSFSVGRLILWFLVLLLLAVLGTAALSGMVPGLSALVGATSARDLGVEATPADFDAVVQRIGYRLENQPAAAERSGYKHTYSGRMTLDQTFTEAELSALLTFNHVNWWALNDVQIRVHEDGVVEASTVVRTDYVPWEQIPQSVSRYLPSVLPAEVPVYLKGRLDVLGPQTVNLSLQKLELGRIPVPASALSPESQQRASDFLNQRIRAIPGFAIQSLTFADGKVRFQGTFPKEFKRVAVGQ